MRWMGHLRESRLLALCLAARGQDDAAPLSAREAGHLETCPRCTRRRAELAAFLAGLTEEALAAADAAFSPERLVAQRVRILRRLERLLSHRGPARILPFPALGRPRPPAVRRVRRWVAAGAAAGLLVGGVLGRFVVVHQNPGGSELPAPSATRTPDEAAPPVSASADELLLEERLLLEIEDALGAPRVEELRAIDEVTPRIQDVAFNFR